MSDHVLKAQAGSFAMSMGKASFSVHSPLPENHPAYALLGRLASEWGHLEVRLDATIWALAEMPPNVGACITSQMMGHTPRFLAMIALLKHHCVKPEFIERSQELLRKSYDLAEKRNRCLHDAWYFEMVSEAVHQRKSVTRKDIVDEKNLRLNFGMQDTGGIEAIEKTIKSVNKLTEQVSILAENVLASRRP